MKILIEINLTEGEAAILGATPDVAKAELQNLLQGSLPELIRFYAEVRRITTNFDDNFQSEKKTRAARKSDDTNPSAGEGTLF